MQNAEKKIAAAIAAIQLYLHDEAALSAAQEDPGLTPAILPPVEPGFWSQSGRMDMMAARRMLQLHAFSLIR